MTREINLKSICDYLNKDGDEKTLQLTSTILGIAIISTPIILGPTAFFALSLLTAKNELISTGKILIKKFTSKKHETDSLERLTKLEMAYGLIFYTAFFDTIDKLMPKDIRKIFEETLKNKSSTSNLKQDEIEITNQEQQRFERMGPFYENVPLPHPAVDFNTTKEQLLDIYTRMAKDFGFFCKTICQNQGNDQNIEICIDSFINKIATLSLKRFEAQYIHLASIYEDFKIWVILKEKEYLKKENSDFVHKFGELQLEQKKSLDVGLGHLQDIVKSLPCIIGRINAQNVIDGLKNHYRSAINETIVEDKEISYEGKLSLKFPKLSEAFIPQAYRVLRYDSSEIRLEQETTWSSLKTNNNISTFILRFLNSPTSIDHPLLILGHPGSGKSLLTKILCARLIGDTYTPIRIPLREVNAELQIETLIEKQIEKDSGHKIDNWADFASQFKESPLLIILDGYDELLQASGKVFAGFLDKIQKFQQSQQVQNRPVRIIATSRITLIDKASVPDGCTILRLLEFDQEKRDAWIEIWNRTNDNYFSSSSSVKQFTLPRETKNGKKDKLLDLAEQPLLLLMLALYDSEANSLSRTKKIDRTVLYDSLLRIFVRRERRRYTEDFDHLGIVAQNEILDFEIKRLGVAAIGMYNRRKLHILSSELINDLNFFSTERTVKEGHGHILSQADFLLGSFFFIHESSAKIIGKNDQYIDTAFEFMHNTFGEFLTADFILKYSLDQTEILQEFAQSPSLMQEYHKKLNDPNGLPDEWFACLMFSPLHTRPVIPEMLREWTSHVLAQKKRNKDDFIKYFDLIIKSQLSIILNTRSFPSIMQSPVISKVADIPILGLIANYTINLIILKSIFSGDFIFDELEFMATNSKNDQSDQSTDPWDKLTYIWRAWFKIENLSGISTILSSRRHANKIHIRYNKSFTASLCNSQLSHIINATSSIADELTFGLASLHSNNCNDDDDKWLENINKSLVSAQVDISFEILIRQLRYHISGPKILTEKIHELISKGITQLYSDDIPKFLAISFFDLITLAHQRGYIDFNSNEIKSELYSLLKFSKFSNTNPLSNRIFWLVLELDNETFLDNFFSDTTSLYDQGTFSHSPTNTGQCFNAFDRHHSSYYKSGIDSYLFNLLNINTCTNSQHVPSKLIEKWLIKARKSGYLRLPRSYIERIFESIDSDNLLNCIRQNPSLANEYLKLAHNSCLIDSADRFIKLYLEIARHNLNTILKTIDYDYLAEFLSIIRTHGDDSIKINFTTYLLKRIQRLVRLTFSVLSNTQTVVELTRMTKETRNKKVNRELDKIIPLFFKSEEILNTINSNTTITLSFISLLRHLKRSYTAEFMEKLKIKSIDFSQIPADLIGDLTWYAETTNDNNILSQLTKAFLFKTEQE